MFEVTLDREVEVKVKKYANGIGVDVEDVLERAIKYALRSRYPDQGLPSQPGRPDQGLPGAQPGPDQGLPGEQPGIDNSLPRPPFDGTIDNELPDGDIPPEIDNSLPGYQPRPDQGLPGGQGGRPDQGLPSQGVNPDLIPNVNPDISGKNRPGQELPETPEPKA
jgi:hypothetical protein